MFGSVSFKDTRRTKTVINSIDAQMRLGNRYRNVANVESLRESEGKALTGSAKVPPIVGPSVRPIL